ncbi:hypothetical protein B0H34DRAFT_380322 [Crassisporium funariophilum]|nr:hypothetical protein B0H34DRAFT_380322 [Crassisporium funariophilum]
MTLTQGTRLPATFTSLYRLFLRTSSAAVLHHNKARLNLWVRWRPVFDAGARVVKEVEHNHSCLSQEVKHDRVEWLKLWNQRMDHTLALLYTSCKSRGLPHRLTRNLAFFVAAERQRLRSTHKKMKVWQPQDKSLSITPQPLATKVINTLAKKGKEAEFENNAASALNEVLRMAESSGGLTLGSNSILVRIKRYA